MSGPSKWLTQVVSCPNVRVIHYSKFIQNLALLPMPTRIRSIILIWGKNESEHSLSNVINKFE